MSRTLRSPVLRVALAASLLGLLPACSGGEGDGGEPAAPSKSGGAGPAQGEATQKGARAQVQDLLLRTRREKHVKGKPEWLSSGDVDGDGVAEVLAAEHSPGAILLWRDPSGEAESIAVGDYPLRPALLGKLVAVASRADRSLVLYDLAKPGAPREHLRMELPDVPMVLVSGVLDESRGAELFVATKEGFLLRAGPDGITSTQQVEQSNPRSALVFAPEAGLLVGFQSSESLEVYGHAPDSSALEVKRSIELPSTARDLLAMELDGDEARELILVEGEHGGWIYGTTTEDPFEAGTHPLHFGTTAIPLRLLATDGEASKRWSLLAASSVACEVWDWLDGSPKRLLYSYAGQTPRDLLLHDASGDGRADYWVANRDAHVISLLRNDENGPIQPIKVGVGTFPNDLATGDIDGDGLDELFVINAKDQNISVLGRRAKDDQQEGQGNQRSEWIHGYKLPTGPSPRAVLSANIDGDEHQDLMWLDRTHATTRLVVRLGDGKGSLRVPEGFEPIPLGQAARDFVVESFNGEGQSLVVAADQDGRRLMWTRVAREGERIVHSAIHELALPGPPRAITTMFQGETARGIAIAVQTAPDRSVVQIYVPVPDEASIVQWRKLGEVSLPGAVQDLASGDLDADGIDDLAYLASDREGSVGGLIQPLLVKGGKPTPLAQFSTGLRPQRILAADFSGDGRAELFVANLDSHNVNVWMPVPGDDALGFRRLDDIGAGVGCIALCATDLDGDQDADLVVVDSANDGVSLILNETY